MIFGNIGQEKTNKILPEEIRACFQYVKAHDLENKEKGSYQIDGDAFFFNLVEYETCALEERFWEAHRKYIDVHIMLRGQERIDVNFIENMLQKPYEEKDDFLPLTGDAAGYIDLSHSGDFLICYPDDAHRTAIKVKESGKIKKAIFKVLLK